MNIRKKFPSFESFFPDSFSLFFLIKNEKFLNEIDSDDPTPKLAFSEQLKLDSEPFVIPIPNLKNRLDLPCFELPFLSLLPVWKSLVTMQDLTRLNDSSDSLVVSHNWKNF